MDYSRLDVPDNVPGLVQAEVRGVGPLSRLRHQAGLRVPRFGRTGRPQSGAGRSVGTGAIGERDQGQRRHRPRKTTTHEIPIEEWERMPEVNLFEVRRATRHCALSQERLFLRAALLHTRSGINRACSSGLSQLDLGCQ